MDTTWNPAIALDDFYGEKPEKATYEKIAIRVMESIAQLKPVAS